ncbi:MAG TPA: hypothetical protein PKD61_13625, partial [Polyangiaceae bacterium]|nr:hypothetical protein [Polyangiaceae bacterium]
GSGGRGGGGGAGPTTDGIARPPATAVLFVLDRSLSMSMASKWAAAGSAIQQALSSPAFDNVGIGLLTYPSVTAVPAPTCISHIVSTVQCGLPASLDVPIQDSGTSSSTGPRAQINTWLSSNQPVTAAGDASPGYDALAAAYKALEAYSAAQRAVVFVTDGGFSCTSVSAPTRPAYNDAIGCPDWEQPDSVTQLVTKSFTSSTKKIRSFFVGVPGSDSTGQSGTAPYHMRLALSAYACAGSPDMVAPGCECTFTKSGGDPASACHFDMTQGGFSAAALATTLAEAQQRALDCKFLLPKGPDGGVLDQNQLNVSFDGTGQAPVTVPRRSVPTDSCTLSGCWDYSGPGEWELLGAACSALVADPGAKVSTVVGCPTIKK